MTSAVFWLFLGTFVTNSGLILLFLYSFNGRATLSSQKIVKLFCHLCEDICDLMDSMLAGSPHTLWVATKVLPTLEPETNVLTSSIEYESHT